MVSKDQKLSVRRQCALMTLTRSNLYYEPKGENAENLRFMDIMHCPLGGMRSMIPRGNKQFLTPWYGPRQMARHMKRDNHKCGRHRAHRLMRLRRLVPIYQEPNTSKLNRPQFAGGSKVSMDGAYGKKVTEQTGFRPRSAPARFG
jgi:putative transposase